MNEINYISMLTDFGPIRISSSSTAIDEASSEKENYLSKYARYDESAVCFDICEFPMTLQLLSLSDF